MQFTASEAFGRDLEKAKALLSHRLPQCRIADVLGLALGLLLEDLEKGGKKVGRRLAENRKGCGKKSSFEQPAGEQNPQDNRDEEQQAESSPLASDQSALADHQNEERKVESLPLVADQRASEDHQSIHGAQTANPEGAGLKIPGFPVSRYIPRGIQRTIWHRDDGRCQYPRPDGTVCGETHFLELDHIHPFSLHRTFQRTAKLGRHSDMHFSRAWGRCL